MKIEIAPIEDQLAELGIETLYNVNDDSTSFCMALGSGEIEILDGVSGDYIRPYEITEALFHPGTGNYSDVSDHFIDVTDVDEFVKAAEAILSRV